MECYVQRGKLLHFQKCASEECIIWRLAVFCSSDIPKEKRLGWQDEWLSLGGGFRKLQYKNCRISALQKRPNSSKVSWRRCSTLRLTVQYTQAHGAVHSVQYTQAQLFFGLGSPCDIRYRRQHFGKWNTNWDGPGFVNHKHNKYTNNHIITRKFCNLPFTNPNPSCTHTHTHKHKHTHTHTASCTINRNSPGGKAAAAWC